MTNWREPEPGERCTAKSKQANRQCLRFSQPGQDVCYYHGGAAPAAKANADRRLAVMADRAMEVLADEMEFAESSRDRIRAAIATLDRAGFGALRRIEITPGAVEQEIARLEAELAAVEDEADVLP